MGNGASCMPAETVDNCTTFPVHCSCWSRRQTTPFSCPTTLSSYHPQTTSALFLIQKKVYKPFQFLNASTFPFGFKSVVNFNTVNYCSTKMIKLKFSFQRKIILYEEHSTSCSSPKLQFNYNIPLLHKSIPYN